MIEKHQSPARHRTTVVDIPGMRNPAGQVNGMPPSYKRQRQPAATPSTQRGCPVIVGGKDRRPRRVVITNRSSELVDFVLEPLSEVNSMGPGQARAVTYASGASPEMGVKFDGREIRLCEEGDGALELQKWPAGGPPDPSR
jgi:hypothetical protein